MKRRVVVTGIGAVTSLGCKVEELWTRICNGESGVGPLERFDVADYRVRFGGEIRNWSIDGYIEAKDVKRFDRFVQFAHGRRHRRRRATRASTSPRKIPAAAA